MRRSSRLKLSRDFEKIYREGRSVVSPELVLYYLKKETFGDSRMGVVVSKTFGKAAARNKVKRLLRESYRHNEARIKPGYDLCVIARHPLKEKSFQEVEKIFLAALLKADLLKKEG